MSPNRSLEKPARRRLPDERRSLVHEFEIAGETGHVIVGFHEDGAVGEIAIKMGKHGSTLSGLLDALSRTISLALEYGAPIDEILNELKGTRFEPSGVTNNPEVPLAGSPVDYLAKAGFAKGVWGAKDQ